MFSLLLVNLFILLCRPQNDLPLIGTVQLPILLSLPLLLITISKFKELWQSGSAVRAMLGLLVFGAVWVPFARNNFWAFNSFRDIAQQFFVYLFPLIVLVKYVARIRVVFQALAFFGIYLSAYALTHAGRGPGGFLGDENDICQLLVGLVCALVAIFPAQRKVPVRLLVVGAVVMLLAGIVSTSSRGGFVGLLGGAAYVFYRSKHKLKIIMLCVPVVLLGSFFTSAKYWNDMQTITDTKESTADARLSVWSTGMRLWLDPPNFVFGTGMSNATRYLGQYETAEQLAKYPSQSGRAVHSTPVQLVCDLGLLGLVLVVVIMGGTLRRNHLLINSIHKQSSLLRKLMSASSEVNDGDGPAVNSEVLVVISRSQKELVFLENSLVAFNSGLIGAVCASLFISTLYYPTLWFFTSLAIGCRLIAEPLHESLLALVNEPN